MDVAVASVCTSTIVIFTIMRLNFFADVSLLEIAFFSILPTFVAISLAVQSYWWETYERLIQRIVYRNTDPSGVGNGTKRKFSLDSARAELYRAFNERWLSKGRNFGSFYRIGQVRSGRLSQSSSEFVADTNGKSLYDQVKENLTDHVFPSYSVSGMLSTTANATPIYFMDPTTGEFLKVTEQHKLVFTMYPDASCLFQVVKGKTHHWGFQSSISQRFLGQNFVGKVVVNSKKMNSWEAFRVLQRPEGDANGVTGTNSKKQCSSVIYLILCSSRFGKGMWFAKNRSGQVGQEGSNTSSAVMNSGSASEHGHHGGKKHRSLTYLSKNFANALALVYASDLSAFEYLKQDPSRQVGGIGSFDANLPITTAQGTTFQTPVLTTSKRSSVLLPWLDEPRLTSPQSAAKPKRFLELEDDQLVGIMSATIEKCTVRDYLELFIDEDTRRQANERSNGISATVTPPSTEKCSLSEWHLHPQFGYVRNLAYRPPTDLADASSKTSLKSIAIDQYHSCSIDETNLLKATFQSKLYTLGIPYSNCFSIEVWIEIEELQSDIGKEERHSLSVKSSNTSKIQFHCRAGVHFTRPTALAAQIERGAKQGVRKGCELLMRIMKKSQGERLAPPASDSSEQQGTPSDRNSNPTDKKYQPSLFAMEVIRGLIDVICDTKNLYRNHRLLSVQFPWKPYAVVDRPQQNSASSSLSTSPSIGTPVVQMMTAVPFFESSLSQFQSAVEINLGAKITPELFFETLLCDECSFFHAVQRQSGNMEVDIGPWQSSQTSSASTDESDISAPAFIRKQSFRMPLSGIPGVDMTAVEDYHYYALVGDQQGKRRLEFGMKIFAKDLPEGEKFSIEVAVRVETSGIPSSNFLRVHYAIPSTGIINRNIGAGVRHGIKELWKYVSRVMVEAGQSNIPRQFFRSLPDIGDEEIKLRLRSEVKLPRHDELSSRLIEAIATAY